MQTYRGGKVDKRFTDDVKVDFLGHPAIVSTVCSLQEDQGAKMRWVERWRERVIVLVP